MKRSSTASAAAASTMPSRPIAFWSSRFFLLIIRETPRFSLRPSTPDVSPPPLRVPSPPGVEFVTLEPSVLLPHNRETLLDAHHTLRFCRFFNTLRRHYSTTSTRVHFVVRSQLRGDEATVLLLLVRWRLLGLQLSPPNAVAPFAHLQSLFNCDFVDLEASLSGVAKGVANNWLFSASAFQDETKETETNSRDTGCFTRITTRFLLFPSPIDPPSVATVQVPEASDPEEGEEASPSLSVAQLAPQLKPLGVSMVVKLNALPSYDDQLIVRSGVDHLDLSSHTDVDGVALSVVTRFLESCEQHASPHSVIAVHSSSGFGRAAFCIACFLIKHAQYSAAEAIGWLRFCCPEALSVSWARQLQRAESLLRRDGEAFRRRKVSMTLDSPRSRKSLPIVEPSQINIGQIALGRDSLLGTITKDKPMRETRTAQILPLPGAYRELIAADAVLGTQTKRRPLTQGAAGARRRMLPDHHHGDFATLHKFLHRQSSYSSSSGLSGKSSLDRTSSTTAPDCSGPLPHARSRGLPTTPHTFD